MHVVKAFGWLELSILCMAATQFKSSAALLCLAFFMCPGIDTIHLYNTVSNSNVYQRLNKNQSTKSLLVLKTPSRDVRRMCVHLLDHVQKCAPVSSFFSFCFDYEFYLCVRCWSYFTAICRAQGSIRKIKNQVLH